MKLFAGCIGFSVLMLMFAPNQAYGQDIQCDVTCAPSPTASSYESTVASRSTIPNARGFTSPTVARSSTSASSANGESTIVGSQSYNYVIPVLGLTGRAGLDLKLNLYYNSRIWDINLVNGTATFNADRDYPSYGFRLDFGYLEYDLASAQYILTEGDGSKHGMITGGNGVGSGPGIYDSTDGTYIRYTESQTTLAYRNGRKVKYEAIQSQPGTGIQTLFRPIWVVDTNGNFISIAYASGHDQFISTITDTLGRVIHFNYDGSNRLTSIIQNVQTSAVDPTGVHTYSTFAWGTVPLNYNFSLAVANSQASGTQINVITSCTYANGTGYRFTYGDWGIVNKIENLSSNGTPRSYISHNYPLASQGALADAPRFTQETISPDGTSANASSWTYSTSFSSPSVVSSMSVTDPNGNIKTTNLDPAGLLTSIQAKDSSGTPLITTSYTWTTSDVGTVPSVITTTLNDTGQQSSVHYTYDLYGNATDVYEYDFGNILKRHTVTTYLSTNIPWWHIINLPTQILVKDGGGSVVSRTDLAYDNYATTPLTTVTGVTHHDDGFNSSVTIRGNLTSVTRYSNAAAGTGVITRGFTYDTLGNMLTAQLDCCNQKTFNFSSLTTYSQPDSVVRGPAAGPQFTTSYTYSSDFSLLLSNTDENAQVTHYEYSDPMLRPTRVILPPQSGTQVNVNTEYVDTVSPTVRNFSTANSAETFTTLDGLGHVMQVDNRNGSTVVSRVKYVYDSVWQRIKTSNPFVPPDTPLYTTATYDALGRVTLVTPPSGGNTQYQYSGNTVTVIDPAGKRRKSVKDALGRLVEVDEPGETFAGVKAGGTLTIGGPLRSQAGVGATPGTGTVGINGAEQQAPDSGTFDWGPVDVLANGVHSCLLYYGQGDYEQLLASKLATAINNCNSFVTATAGGAVVWGGIPYVATILLTARTSGASTNYSFSASVSTNDSVEFSMPSFSLTPFGATLTGGSNGTTLWDSGTVTVTIGSFTASAPYSQSGNSTAAQVATALVGTGSTGLNRAGSPVTATANGAAITLTYNTVGTTGNVAVTASSSTNDPTHFPGGSFSGSVTLGNGVDAYSTGLSHPYASTYTYDVMNNLKTVSQAAGLVNGQPVSGQARSYEYDSLGRSTSATTPESGTVTMYYTKSDGTACSGDSSLVCRVTDARGVTKTFAYNDGLNRPTGITYSDNTTPPVTYQYDTGGAAAFALDRLTKIIEGTGGTPNSQTFTYDNFGRITQVSHLIDGATYTVQYGYNLASQLASITYPSPSNRVVTQNYDATGRTSSIASGGTSYLSGLSYNAAGEPLGLTMGNGVQGSFTYNDHLQPTALRYVSGSTDVLNLGYDYGASNNGQIQAVHYYTAPSVEDLTKSENFTYDAWGRLSAAHTTTVNSTAGTWSLQWGYDRLGNRLSQTLVGGNITVGQPSFTIDPATNRITNSGYTYDAAGNMTHDASNAYTYDGANRITRINAGPPSYTYFGALRIKKVAGTTTTVYIYSGGKPIVEYVNGSLSTEYIYAGSKLLATIAGSSTTYHHPDHLSNRAETNSSGAVVRTFGQLPFGETWYETGTADKWKFTSYENDSLTGETGLNYAGYRYQAPSLGRFMSADLMSGNIGDPQSLNRYAYVSNDPVNLVDPSGLSWWGAIWDWLNGDGNGYGPRSNPFFHIVVTPEGTGGSDEAEGGGGGGKASKKPCTITFAIGQARPNDPTNLLPGELETAQRTFADAGINVQLNTNGNPDFIVGFTFIPPQGNSITGYSSVYGIAPPDTNVVFVDRNLVSVSNRGSIGTGAVEGRVLAHELGHRLLGPGHVNSGIMRSGVDHGSDLFQVDGDGNFLFTKEQKVALQKICDAMRSHLESCC